MLRVRACLKCAAVRWTHSTAPATVGSPAEFVSVLATTQSSFLAALASAAEQLVHKARKLSSENPNEPWRQFINTMLARLPKVDPTSDQIVHEPPPTYQHSAELLADLRLLYDSMIATGLRRPAEYAVQPLMRIVQTFGFHSAVLDVRQNSAFHDRAVEQLLAAAGIARTNFSQWSEDERLELLQRELASKRPFARPDVSLGYEADAALSALRVLKDYRSAYGDDGLGALIVSMTRNVSDLLVVYLLAREVGLMEETADGLECPCQLYHSSKRLTICGQVRHLRSILESSDHQAQFDGDSKAARSSDPVGQVMIGYSDSNKDGGILASLVNLRHAQRELSQVGRRCGVRVRFFMDAEARSVAVPGPRTASSRPCRMRPCAETCA